MWSCGTGYSSRKFDFTPCPLGTGTKLGIIDFERGVKLTGSRFYILNGAGARLQRALIAWMLDLHIRQGYEERYTPFMVKAETLYAAGQLPKFVDNLYHDIEEDLWMVPTAEVPLTGMYKDEVLEEATLPQRFTAYTPCFRREKMSAGRDVRGIKRGHQFDKVEMYIYCKPEDSMNELEKMLADAEETCKRLGLPYRIKRFAPAIWASTQSSPMTLKCGLQAAMNGWKSHRFQTWEISRHAGQISNINRQTAERTAWFTP